MFIKINKWRPEEKQRKIGVLFTAKFFIINLKTKLPKTREKQNSKRKIIDFHLK